MNGTRRVFLQKVVLGGVSVLALGTAGRVLAAWPEAAFEAEQMDGALEALFGGQGAEESEAVVLKAPDIAENGAVVPISVETALTGVESISILVENNPSPLAARFVLGEGGLADVSTRIKMGETSRVVALVEVEGKVLMASQEVKVTIGGCGG